MFKDSGVNIKKYSYLVKVVMHYFPPPLSLSLFIFCIIFEFLNCSRKTLYGSINVDVLFHEFGFK